MTFNGTTQSTYLNGAQLQTTDDSQSVTFPPRNLVIGGDLYDEDLVFSWAEKLAALGINILSIADTVGLATSHQVGRVTKHLIESLPQVEIGVHLHSTVRYWKEKVDAALHAGCIRFDGALKGIGGCPMAGNDLVGNMNTELMLSYFQELGRMNNINEDALENSLIMASEIFA